MSEENKDVINTKLDVIISTLGTLDKRVSVFETALTGVNGDGGLIADVARQTEKLHRLGNDLNAIHSDKRAIEKDIENIKEDVKKNEEKIGTLFSLTNKDRVDAAGTATKVGIISAIALSVFSIAVNFIFKES